MVYCTVSSLILNSKALPAPRLLLKCRQNASNDGRVCEERDRERERERERESKQVVAFCVRQDLVLRTWAR